jgi:hypothetical protein
MGTAGAAGGAPQARERGGLVARMPDGALLILLPERDPALAALWCAAGLRAMEAGRAVALHRVPADASAGWSRRSGAAAPPAGRALGARPAPPPPRERAAQRGAAPAPVEVADA